MGKPQQVKVVFPHSEGAETMWADKLADHRYRLDNVPLFVYGVGLGDVFTVKRVDGDDRPYFDRVVERTPNWTYRLILAGVHGEDARRDELLSRVKAHARHSGIFQGTFVSLHVPESPQRDELDALIDEGEREGLWQSEVSSGPDLPVGTNDDARDRDRLGRLPEREN
jgi:Domain of unknown function (DUF4265)